MVALNKHAGRKAVKYVHSHLKAEGKVTPREGHFL
jgi:hypothetical protein